MPEEETYKDKKITISDDGLHLTIDGKEIEVNFDDDAKNYSSYDVLPYDAFDTLLDLAKAIIDKKNGGNWVCMKEKMLH